MDRMDIVQRSLKILAVVRPHQAQLAAQLVLDRLRILLFEMSQTAFAASA